MIEKTANADSNKTTFISRSWVVCQHCLLCDNTREIPHGYGVGNYPWVCDECKEAIAFIKDFRKNCGEAQKMLDEMKDSR